MLQEPIIFLTIYMISIILKNFLLSERAGVLSSIARRIFFIGVIFHECAHYVMSLVVGMVPKSIIIKWRKDTNPYDRNPHGVVQLRDSPSFLQSFVIASAPLYFSTWLIFWLWFGVIFTPFFNPFIKIVAIFLLISLLLTAAPSGRDIKMIGNSFKIDPLHSWYQIFLISLSILILWIYMVITQVTFFLEVFYYITIAGIYLLLRFSLISIRKLVNRISSYNFKNPRKIRFRRFTRKYYRPAKP